MSIDNKNTVLATNQKVSEGVDKHFAKVKNLTLAGVTYTPATLKATFAAETDAHNALDQSRAQLKEQVATARAAQAKASAARKGLKAYVLGNYGAQAVNVLADFGMTPPKTPGPKTSLAKAQAAARAKATRKARHTMGKRERLAIQADPVTLVAEGTEEASTAPSAPAAAPSVVPTSAPAHS
jgi:hypothetical protein